MTNVGRGCLLIVTDAVPRPAPFPRTVPESVHRGAAGEGAIGLDVELPQPSAVNARAPMMMTVRMGAMEPTRPMRLFNEQVDVGQASEKTGSLSEHADRDDREGAIGHFANGHELAATMFGVVDGHLAPDKRVPGIARLAVSGRRSPCRS